MVLLLRTSPVCRVIGNLLGRSLVPVRHACARTRQRSRLDALRNRQSSYKGERRGKPCHPQPRPPSSRSEVTELLVAWREGNAPRSTSSCRSWRRSFASLRAGISGASVRAMCFRQRRLVNEAFVRLLNWQDVSWQNRAHFVAMAARLMRNILVDIARRRAKGRDGREIRIVDIAEAEDGDARTLP